MANVLGILGSARPDGNTNDLLDAVLKQAAKEGAETDKIILANHRVEQISNCKDCIEAGQCVHADDDFTMLMEKVFAADVLIFASPVYWYTVSGLLKTFIDRWSCYIYRDGYDTFVAKMRPKAGGIVTVQEETGYERAQHLIGALENTIRFAGGTYLGYVLGTGGARGTALRDSKAVKEATLLGQKAAKFKPPRDD